VLRAKVKFNGKSAIGEKIARNPGDEWLFYGQNYYLPRDEIEIIKEQKCRIIKNNQALVLRAKKDFKDRNGIKRKAGDKWLMRDKGAYLQDVQEEVEKELDAHVLDDETSLLLRANFDFVDFYGEKRKAGQEWLISNAISNTHIIDEFETLVKIQKKIILVNDEYCIICNPYDQKAKSNLMGTMMLVKGVDSFFLNPGESLKNGKVEKAYILDENEGFLVQAIESFEDEDNISRNAGDKWIINGPLKFIPGVEIRIIEKRQKIPLDKHEGIYIRNIKTGKLFKHIGSSYFLSPDEELWEKELSENIERIYLRDQNLKIRNKSRIVSYSCPFNCIMQIYNLKTKTNRIIFGPDLAVLDPEEEFTLMSLSGKTPKVSGVVNTLYLKLGPTFSSDEFIVESIDHTKLRLKVSYDWIFDIKNDVDSALKIFKIRDFIGDMVKTLASKIRSTTATIPFEDFHKNSDLYIRKSVFGEDAAGKLNNKLRFEESNLLIRHVDIQSVSPIDATTKELLQKSVSLAIELTTKTYEQEFQIQALIKEQEFKGEVEKLKIQNEIDFIKKEIDLNKLKVESNIIEKNGLSRSEALAFKEALIIESKSKVDLAEMNIEAKEKETEFNLKKLQKEHDSN
jgi:major vault protein